MSFLGGIGGSSDGELDLSRRPVNARVVQRRATHSEHLCSATLACDRCDAPVVVGTQPRSLTDPLTCPFCARTAPARAFLSLASPTRPARVAVRISRPPARRAG